MKRTYITRTILLLSLVSMLTDISSEMLYPVMPLYLQHIGFSIWLIGLLEGFAEAIAGLSKGYFGKWSDINGRRLPFVKAGYFMSALSKPMMAAFTFPAWIFAARSLDRLGKGVRTAARDALLSDNSLPGHKGKVFGFHRGMDTLGAAIGPLLALIYLYYYPQQYLVLFLLAFLPGVAGTLLTFIIKEKTVERTTTAPKQSFFSFMSYWKTASPTYRKISGGLLFFTLFNSSDIFLLLMAKEAGMNDLQMIQVYIFYNLVYALAAYPAGHIGDRLGLKKTLIAGLLLFTTAYGGIAFATTNYQVAFFFFIYGLYAAFTEGISKALISDSCEKKDTATALGFYTGFGSLATMVASSLTGFLWFSFGPKAALICSATGALFIAGYFTSVIRIAKIRN